MKRAKAEVLRYLGFSNQELSPDLDSLVEDCMAMMREEAKPRHICRIFDIDIQAAGVALLDSKLLLRGEDIRRHLKGCSQAAVLAATLGVWADTLIRRWQSVDITRVLVLDACATQYIEEYCDSVEEGLRNEAAQSGLRLTTRFSPGYGDMPLDLQPEILSVLDAEKRIGLTCTENLILLPRKSITALMGRGACALEGQACSNGCESCSKRDDCRFRKGMDHAGFTENAPG